MSGANSVNQSGGVYGTKGVPDAANVPGARTGGHLLDRPGRPVVAVRGHG